MKPLALLGWSGAAFMVFVVIRVATNDLRLKSREIVLMDQIRRFEDYFSAQVAQRAAEAEVDIYGEANDEPSYADMLRGIGIARRDDLPGTGEG